MTVVVWVLVQVMRRLPLVTIRNESGSCHHLPPPRRRAQIHPEKDVEYHHRQTGQARTSRILLSTHIFNQFLTTQDDHASIHIKEWKTRFTCIIGYVSR